jgi:hypothetical protein
MDVTYRPINKGKLRVLFTLHTKELDLTGQIFEREQSGKLDRYFWNFAGKFPWEVGDTLPPFRMKYTGQDCTWELFYGIPQALLLHLYQFIPAAAQKYQANNNRNCGNCQYAQFRREVWEEWQRLSPSQRVGKACPALFGCQVSGELLSARNPQLDKAVHNFYQQDQQGLQKLSCDAHTRKAYEVETSISSRDEIGSTSRWVPSEPRRLGALNPQSFSLKQSSTNELLLQLPKSLLIPIRLEAPSLV